MRVLITGSGSYIGRNIKAWLERTGHIIVDELDMRDPAWIDYDFRSYDTVIHVAAIVHKKKEKIPWSTYYKVNTILPYKVAIKAKDSHVEQFIFLSTMAVYGEGKKLPLGNIIDEKTSIKPNSFYGRSKLEAEKKLIKLNSQSFRVSIVRPPNIYGYGCPGNYINSFVKLVKLTPVIPVTFTNCKQGFLYIDNLSRFIYQLIKDRREGIFHPQDGDGISTFALLAEIADIYQKRVLYSLRIGRIISHFHKLPVIIKIFGGVSYSTSLSDKPYSNYSRVDFNSGLKKTIVNPSKHVKRYHKI